MDKFEKARGVLQKINADGWLIICNEDSDINSHFMLGVKAHARHYVYVDTNGQHQILAVQMEAPMIEKALKSQGVKASVIAYNKMEDLTSNLTRILNKPRIALNFGEDVLGSKGTTYADYIRAGDLFSVQKLAPNTEFFSAASIIYELRAVKSPEELKDMRNVCKATIEILERIPDWVKVSMTEKEVQAKLEYEYMKLGHPSFETIVASGPNSADPHHNSSAKKIKSDALLIDTGMRIDQMCSDITWTFWLGKKPPNEFVQVYRDIYASKQEAKKYYTEGIPNYLPARKCREYLTNKGYDVEKLFTHGLGHALGFEVHDIGERISSLVPEEHFLKENTIYSNEPGLYWEGKWGIRLEDDIIIKKEKCEQVTNVPKDPITI